MIKKLKPYRKWYIPILLLLVVLGAFVGFISSYAESKTHDFMTNIKNYVQLSSYAVRGKILKDQEGVNDDYVNQTLANKRITDEFNDGFIWKPNNTDPKNDDTISSLLQTYFGKSTDLFTDNIKYLDKKDNKLKNIQNTNSANIVPENINNFIGVINSAKKFISGLSSSTVNLGLNLLQKNFLKDQQVVDSIKQNLIVKKFISYVEKNQTKFANIANLLISSSNIDNDASFYQNLTVRQLFNKQLNHISEVITGRKILNHNQDNLPDDLIQYFLNEIITIIKTEFAQKKDIIEKFKSVWNSIKAKFDFKKWKDQLIPALIRYLKTELFFATYYVVNPNLTINQLLDQSASAEQFKALTTGSLDLGVILKGLSLVFQNQESGNRFLDFIFKKVDPSKIYFTSKDQPANIGTGNLLFDILNAVQASLLSITGILDFVIPKIEEYIKQNTDKVKELIIKSLTDLLEKFIPGGNNNNGNAKKLRWQTPKFNNNELEFKIEYNTISTIFGKLWVNVAHGHINFFDNNGLISNLIRGLKDITLASSELLATVSNYLKHIFYRDKERDFDFKKAFTSLSNLLKISNDLFEEQYINQNSRNLVIFIGLGPGDIAKIHSIYDIINLPNARVFTVPIIGNLIKGFVGKYLEPFNNAHNELKKYGFITDTKEFRKQFPEYILKAAEFVGLYYEKNNGIPKYDLVENFYTENGNFATDFTKKWANFFVPDVNDTNNPLLPIVKAILRDAINTDNERIKSLQDVKNEIAISGAKLISDDAFYKNFVTLSNTVIPMNRLAKVLGLKQLRDIKLGLLFDQVGETILDHNKKHPDKIIAFNIAAIGHILKSLTIKVTAKSEGVIKVNDKNIISTIFESLDSVDNKDKDPAAIPKNSYFLWDSVEMKLDGKSITNGAIPIKKIDNLVSPLTILLGILKIGNNQTKYISGSIIHSLSTLIGGLDAKDPLYNLSLENKNSTLFIFDAWEATLQARQKELDKIEYQQAGQYYVSSSWKIKIISHTDNQIKYQLTRTHTSNNDYVKKIGKKFEVMLTKQPDNHSYWTINQVLALDYQQ
ncbi:STREFT protein [Mycoplasma putrefaciens]|uniref:GnsA/GnsB family protein n=1 Tax=Mycoplasma putrefaciens Mput9231 TaxID=1292033 RepID=M9WCP4_9MOLU|nr:STREFT protein [Mycoplasma putrefaciens]AGJ90606.1 Hypothetical protein, predicted transmembrane protein [Mycoplasma putrefaciens Mput9231]